MYWYILILLAFVASCGKGPNNRAGVPIFETKALPVNGSNIQGLYMAKFTTLNPQINGTLPGSATLQRDGDKFYAFVRIFGGAPQSWHQQNVYVGSRCPMLSDDQNGDGYIDIVEGNSVWGKVLIPLDSNLSSQKAGKNIYPMADESGSYFYERVTNFNNMLKDLKSEDKNLEDEFTKIAPDSGIDFIGKVVVVFGTASTVSLPPTVASVDDRPAHQTFPIACGVFAQVTSIPGETLPDEVPVPIEEPESVPEDDYSPTPNRPARAPWYRRLSEWWRRTWDTERGSRRDAWGDGRDWLPF